MRSIMMCDLADCPARVYATKTWETLSEIAGLESTVYSKEMVLANPDAFQDVDYAFSTWGMLMLNEDEIRSIFPNLKCVFYAAGSVQDFAHPYLNCGVKVFSAWGANGVPVAEYTVAEIVLATKGFFQAVAARSVGNHEEAHRHHHLYPGIFEVNVGIIGAGMIGKLVIKLLKNYRLDVLVYDPFLPDETAAELGVKKCSLEELFSSCHVVSNHLANLPATQGILNYTHFSSMLPGATFLNTGRGAQVVEDDLVRALTERPDLTAVLDVTDPEPPVPGHPFYALPNCFLTPHIAGSLGNEVHRMSEYMVDEFTRYINNEKCLYEVTMKMLETMA